MGTKKIKLTEAILFAKDSGYIFAVYEKKDGQHILNNECYLSDIGGNTDILVMTTGEGIGEQIHFNDFITEDGIYRFVLHNNFNLKESLAIKNPETCIHCKDINDRVYMNGTAADDYICTPCCNKGRG